MRARIEVTAEDIRLGKRADACRCPVARALLRVVTTEEVRVVCGVAVIGGAMALLPAEAADFVEAYDRRQPVQPFAFEISPGQESRAFFREEVLR